MRFISKSLICLTVAFLSACGGGGGSAGTVGSGGSVPTPSPVAADFSVAVDKLSLISSSNETATLTVIAVDVNRNVLKDIPVSVSVDAGGIFTPAGSAVTDSAGVFSGSISIGTDKTSRTLKVTVLVGGNTKVLSITVTGTAVTKADYIFELDKTTIDNTGSDKAVLTVTALDADRNVLSGVPVSVSVDAGGVFTRTGGSSTDNSGKFTGNLTIGSDKSNRTINATITAGGVSKVASILVTGTILDATLVSATPQPSESVVVTVTAKDKVGVAIPGATITFGGTAGLTGSFVTDASGSVSRVFTAPASSGNYSVNVTGLGISAAKSLVVINPASSGIPNAVGVASSVSLSPVPSTIAPNLPDSTANKVRLSAKFVTASNTGLENMRVRFEIVPPTLGNGETISTGQGTVYSDASGTAVADYIPGTRSSPTKGVVIRACYKSSDFSSATDCPSFVTTTLTVAATPLSISISNDNKTAKGLANIAYVKTFLLQVNDAAGVAVQNALVAVSVDITHYGKGVFADKGMPSLVPNMTNPSLNVPVPGNSTLPILGDATATPPTASLGVWCVNEDISRNGFLDAGEDINGSNILEPRKAEIIVSYVNGNRTDVNGQLLVTTTYGQNVGSWLIYVLRATTSVAGSEGDASSWFRTTVIDGDIPDGSFLRSPYGVGRCIDKF